MSLLRLVLRPAAGLAEDLGRADRRAGIGRLVQFRLPHPVGLQRPADAHAGRPFLHRGPLQGRQERRDLPRLFRGVEVRRPVAVAEAGHRRGARHGDGPRHPARSSTSTGRPPTSHDYAASTPTCRCWCGWRSRTGGWCRSASCARRDLDGGLGETNNPEWKTVAIDETTGDDRRAARLGRLPLGREGQVEPRGEGRRTGATPSCACRSPDVKDDVLPVAFPYFGNSRHDHFLGTDHAERARCATCR